MKDLPRVFANPIDKNINNNRNFSYGKLEDNSEIYDPVKVQEKINKLFKSDGTVYSIDCEITFDGYKKKYTIIGKTTNNLVTRNQKLIPINEIKDINLAE